MKIAVPYKDGALYDHFGRATEFKIYTVEDLKPIEGEIVTMTDTGHEAVANTLKDKGVDVILCCDIGEHARDAIRDAHMIVFSGVSGAADDVVDAFLEGNLEYSEEANCAQHDMGGCGGSCGSCGGCGGGCGGCGGEVEPYVETRTFTDIVTLTEENFQSEVLDDPGLIIIDFWAEWCQPCRMMAPVFEELNADEPQVKFCKINCDEQPNLAAMFGIESIPTLAVVQDRHTLTGMVGVHSKQEISDMLQKCK